ncbi:hypothetical protein, partial [Salmonella enterica]
KRVLAGFFLSLSLMLTACSGGGGTAAPADQAKPQEGQAQEQSAAKTELVVAAEQEPVGYDPHKVPAASSVRVYALLYDSLTKLDENMN